MRQGTLVSDTATTHDPSDALSKVVHHRGTAFPEMALEGTKPITA